MDCLDAYSRSIEKKSKEQEDKVFIQAVMMYHQAEQIANMIGEYLSKDTRILPLSDYYPDLFDRPDIKERKKKAELSQYAAEMKAFAASHNQRFDQKKEGGETDGSGHDAGEAESFN